MKSAFGVDHGEFAKYGRFFGTNARAEEETELSVKRKKKLPVAGPDTDVKILKPGIPSLRRKRQQKAGVKVPAQKRRSA